MQGVTFGEVRVRALRSQLVISNLYSFGGELVLTEKLPDALVYIAGDRVIVVIVAFEFHEVDGKSGFHQPVAHLPHFINVGALVTVAAVNRDGHFSRGAAEHPHLAVVEVGSVKGGCGEEVGVEHGGPQRQIASHRMSEYVGAPGIDGNLQAGIVHDAAKDAGCDVWKTEVHRDRRSHQNDVFLRGQVRPGFDEAVWLIAGAVEQKNRGQWLFGIAFWRNEGKVDVRLLIALQLVRGYAWGCAEGGLREQQQQCDKRRDGGDDHLLKYISTRVIFKLSYPSQTPGLSPTIGV
jgi:hypothetical protein